MERKQHGMELRSTPTNPKKSDKTISYVCIYSTTRKQAYMHVCISILMLILIMQDAICHKTILTIFVILVADGVFIENPSFLLERLTEGQGWRLG